MKQPGVATTDPGTRDEHLVDRALGGDLSAFDELVIRYQDRIYNLVYRMVGSAEEAEDVAQETFLRAHRALGSFRKGAGFYTWLYRIGVNACHSKARKDIRRRRVEGVRLGPSDDDEQRPISDPEANTDSPDEAAERTETQRRVHEAVQSLSEEYREVVLLRDFEAFDYDGIAEIIGVSKAAIKSRLHRARVELAGKLKDLR